MISRAQMLGAAALAAALACFFAWPARSSPPAPRAKATETVVVQEPEVTTEVTTAAPMPEPSLQRPTFEEPEARALALVRAAKADPSDVGLAKLVASVASDDVVVVAEAADGLVARRAVDALPALVALDPHKSTGAAIPIIDALGRLAGMASGEAKARAVSRLVDLLSEEKKRGAADSAGNLIQIYEALGEARAGADALEAALEDPSVRRAPKVAIVGSLARIQAKTSRAAIERERARHAAPEPDAFEEEIRQDLLHAMDAALTELP